MASNQLVEDVKEMTVDEICKELAEKINLKKQYTIQQLKINAEKIETASQKLKQEFNVDLKDVYEHLLPNVCISDGKLTAIIKKPLPAMGPYYEELKELFIQCEELAPDEDLVIWSHFTDLNNLWTITYSKYYDTPEYKFRCSLKDMRFTLDKYFHHDLFEYSQSDSNLDMNTTIGYTLTKDKFMAYVTKDY